jgi:RNA polymerase sigma factor (sigma-70 family)
MLVAQGLGTMDSNRPDPPCELARPASFEYEHSLEGLIGRSRARELTRSLSEDQWETIRLHFFEGYTLSEIAEKRNQSLGNVRHHFYRGLERIRSSVFGDHEKRSKVKVLSAGSQSAVNHASS